MLLFCISGFSVHAQLQDSHFYKVDDKEISSDFEVDSFWKTDVEGFFLSNRESRERLMKVKLYGKFDLEFNSYIFARFEPYLVVKEGEIQSRRLTRSESAIQMNQGFFDIRPEEGFSVQIGAINQEYLSSPLLLDNYSFLSALFSYSYIKEHYEIQTVIQQSMPSVINSFRRNNEIADVPYFTSLFTYGEWIPSDYYSFKGHVTGFYFTKLPSFIAYESKSYGNTVIGNGQSSTEFAYSYYGVNFDISSQLKIIPEMYVSFGYNGLRNFDAPFDKSWGERVYSVLDMSFWKFVKLYSRVEYFYNNSDSAPAYFNSAIYGHNNRKGFLMELKAFVPKGNFEIGVRYVLSDPVKKHIINSSIGKRQHSFMVFIGSRYSSI